MTNKDSYQIVLFTSDVCHLCEQAKKLLNELQVNYQMINIKSNIELKKRYGVSIPVLAKVKIKWFDCDRVINSNNMIELELNESNELLNDALMTEIYWPFDLNLLTSWLETKIKLGVL